MASSLRCKLLSASYLTLPLPCPVGGVLESSHIRFILGPMALFVTLRSVLERLIRKEARRALRRDIRLHV